MALLLWILASVLVVAGAKKCDYSQVNTCTASMSSIDFNSLDKACTAVAEVKTCLNSLAARCPAFRDSIASGLAGVEQQIGIYCSPSGCYAVKFLKCTSSMSGLNMTGTPTKETCELMAQPINCFEEILATCPDGQEKQTSISQLNMLKQQHQMCVAMTGGGPMSPGQGGQACGPEGLMQCHMMGAGGQTDPSDAKGNCKALGDSKTCLEQLSATCANSPFGGQIMNTTSTVSTQWAMFCAGSQEDCSADVLKCSALPQAEVKDDSPTVLSCESVVKTVQCIEGLRSTCNKALLTQLDVLLNSVYPQYQICIQMQSGKSDQSSTKSMGHKPTKQPGHGGKKPTTSNTTDGDDVHHPQTKKPKGDHNHDKKPDVDKDTVESKGMKYEDNKKADTSDNNENGSSLTTASFLLAVTAVGIVAVVQGRF